MAIEHPPILTVTLNPALDLSARVPAMIAGPKLRMDDVQQDPGGGGVNVARAIHLLGGPALAWVALGGASGARHLDLLRAQGIATHAFESPGDTRQSWAITDDQGQQFRLQLPGEPWDAELCTQALGDIVSHAQGLVVLSGSQPPGVPPDFPQQLAGRLGPDRLIVDTSGAALARLVNTPDPQAQPFLLRLDQAEAEALAGRPLVQVSETAALAQALLATGVATHVCLARGADGSVLANARGTHHCAPPTVPVVSKVGAGDSLTGALALAFARGDTPADALRLGTAAAAAAVMTPGTQLCRAEDVARLRAECTLAVL